MDAHSDTVLGSEPPARGISGVEATLATGLLGEATLRLVAPEHFLDRRELKCGGMGRILTARDPRLERRVAIKELRADSPDLRARFEREVRLTARLEHPSIVGIHEAGRWPSGEPFFAMRFVKGRSLDEAIATTSTFAERIALVPNVLAVADALAFAHNEGVIHRDLKPHNVMVGDFGETVVIDWGLAKDLRDATSEPRVRTGNDDAAQTSAGEILGTPHYMPPEQAEGLMVDERADVYAIGAMLYHVLAGTTPYSGKTTAAILDAVTTRPPAPLAEQAPAVPPDLIAIVERAMARDQDARYRTARELADDLRRFHSGQLVGAHHYSPSQLLRRWLAKHRGAVTVTAVAVLVLVTVGVLGVNRIIAEEKSAITARQLADRNRAAGDGLVQFMLYDLAEKLRPIGKLDLLETVARKARAHYESQPGALDAEAQKALATARYQLAAVLRDQNDAPGALVEYRAALAIVDGLALTRPGDLSLARWIVIIRRGIGDVLVQQGKHAEVLAEYQASLDIATRLATISPSSLQAQSDRAMAHGRLGDAYEARGDIERAVTAFRANRDALAGLVGMKPDSISYQRNLSGAHDRVADGLRQLGDLGGARAEHEAAKTIAVKLLAAAPDDAELQRDLMVSHSLIGAVLILQGNAQAALAEFKAALVLCERLSAQDPTNADARRDLAVAHLKIGEVYEMQHNDAALVSYRSHLALVTTLAAQDATNANVARDAGIGRLAVARVLSRIGDHAAAIRELREAQAIFLRLGTAQPESALLRRDRMTSHLTLGTELAATDDSAGALAEYRAILALADGATDGVEMQRTIEVTHNKIGHVLMATDPAAALVSYRKAWPIAVALAAKDATNLGAQFDVAIAQASIGNALVATGDRAGGQVEYHAALATYEKLVAADSTNQHWAEELQKMRDKLAER